MKKTVFFILGLVLSTSLFAQRKVDLGFIGGTDFYLGDINSTRLFYSPRYAVGPIFRYNIDDRVSVRFHGVYANLSGTDSDFENNITKRPTPVSFSVNLVNIASQVEYNFFDYKTGIEAGEFTPYMFGGIGYSMVLSSTVENSGVSPEQHFTIPFGVGSKLNVTRRMSAGVEWSMNKAFSDRLDGVISPLDDAELLMFNNDWYSFFGLFITYKFFKFAADCPTYD
ncbi:MAG: hypothetical protein JXA77_17005 [Bacteroidales bacterium]|nr:hypothetical protein [Bacteroidales bacterium]MBN2819401.1 hypothetical protein [Bacteroidales bacterium]